MRLIFLCFASFFLLFGCAERIMQEEIVAERNMVNWKNLKLGMNENQVLYYMSFPDRKEFHVVNEQEYVVWFYLTDTTKPVFVKKFSKKNFSPVVFRNGVVIGYGYDFYNYVFDVNDEKRKMEEEKRMQYTDNPEEWPSKDHKIILPPSQEEKPVENDIQKGLREPEQTNKNNTKDVQKEKPTPSIPQCEKRDKGIDEKNYNWWE